MEAILAVILILILFCLYILKKLNDVFGLEHYKNIKELEDSVLTLFTRIKDVDQSLLVVYSKFNDQSALLKSYRHDNMRMRERIERLESRNNMHVPNEQPDDTKVSVLDDKDLELLKENERNMNSGSFIY